MNFNVLLTILQISGNALVGTEGVVYSMPEEFNDEKLEKLEWETAQHNIVDHWMKIDKFSKLIWGRVGSRPTYLSSFLSFFFFKKGLAIYVAQAGPEHDRHPPVLAG